MGVKGRSQGAEAGIPQVVTRMSESSGSRKPVPHIELTITSLTWKQPQQTTCCFHGSREEDEAPQRRTTSSSLLRVHRFCSRHKLDSHFSVLVPNQENFKEKY